MKTDCTCPRANHQHGTVLAYTHDKCRCPQCREAHRTNMADRRRQQAYGRYDQHQRPATHARNHIKTLRQTGIVIGQIAKLSGVSTDTIGRISLGKNKTIQAITEKKILAIKPDPANVRPVTLIDGTGTARRLQALVTLGWSQAGLGRMLGAETPQMWKIIHGQPVTQAMANRITDLYNELWNREPPQETYAEKHSYRTAKNAARRNGWLPPLCWDEDRMDDPKHAGYPKEVAA